MRLRQLRKEAHMSQADLAKHLNIGQTTLSSWETGKRVPDEYVLKEIAKFFDVSIEYLMETEDIAPVGSQSLNITSYDLAMRILENFPTLISNYERVIETCKMVVVGCRLLSAESIDTIAPEKLLQTISDNYDSLPESGKSTMDYILTEFSEAVNDIINC